MTEHDDILDGICDSMIREPKKWQISGNFANFYKKGDNEVSYMVPGQWEPGPDVTLSFCKSLVTVTKPCQVSSDVLSPQAMEDLAWEFENLKKRKFQELVIRLSDRFPPRSEPGERTEIAVAVARLMRDSTKWQGSGEWFIFYEDPQNKNTNSANLSLKVVEWTETKWFSKKIKKMVLLTFRDPDFPNRNGVSIEFADEDKEFLYAEAQVLKKVLILRELGSTRIPSGL